MIEIDAASAEYDILPRYPKTSSSKLDLTKNIDIKSVKNCTPTEGLYQDNGSVVLAAVLEHARVRVWESRAAGRDDTTRSPLQTGLVTGRSVGNAGAVAAFVTTPSDAVEMRMILDARTHEESETGAKLTRKQAKKRACTIAQEVYGERDVQGLSETAALPSGWTMLCSGVYLGAYEMTKGWFKEAGQGDDVGS
ncbi:hypothetical protein BKA56DRAFT_614539 [Ilyonectria sp. MPI-CAGE-AT-0026]|nr:hypothetical protein BKA56DRAFT_614539 [Ilyonectria sp. MPI-CAGE-AT-0026]